MAEGGGGRKPIKNSLFSNVDSENLFENVATLVPVALDDDDNQGKQLCSFLNPFF